MLLGKRIITNKDEEVSNFKEREFYSLIEKRINKMPISYILKTVEFMVLMFLIPRGDTEVLVEEAFR